MCVSNWLFRSLWFTTTGITTNITNHQTYSFCYDPNARQNRASDHHLHDRKETTDNGICKSIQRPQYIFKRHKRVVFYADSKSIIFCFVCACNSVCVPLNRGSRTKTSWIIRKHWHGSNSMHGRQQIEKPDGNHRNVMKLLVWTAVKAQFFTSGRQQFRKQHLSERCERMCWVVLLRCFHSKIPSNRDLSPECCAGNKDRVFSQVVDDISLTASSNQ